MSNENPGHWYMANLSRLLTEETQHLNAILRSLDNDKDNDLYCLVQAIYIRKLIELNTFNKKQKKGLFDYNFKLEAKRIEEEKYVIDEIKSSMINSNQAIAPYIDTQAWEKSIKEREERSKNFSQHGFDFPFSKSLKKTLGIVDDGWEIALDSFPAGDLGQSMMGLTAVPVLAHEISLNLSEHNKNEDKITKSYASPSQVLTAEKIKHYENRRDDYQFRSRLSAINTGVAVTGVGISLYVGIGSALAYAGLLPAAIAASITPVSLFIPLALSGIFLNKWFMLDDNYQRVNLKIEKLKKNKYSNPQPDTTNEYKQVKFKYKQKQKVIEKKRAYTGLEVAGSILCSIGAITSVALLLAGSVATMGALPAALLGVGGAIMLGAAIFEWVDEKNNFKYSTSIENFFKGIKKEKTKEAIDPELNEKLESCLGNLDKVENKERSISSLNTIYKTLLSKSEKKVFRRHAWKKIKAWLIKPNKGSEEARKNKLAYLNKIKEEPIFAENVGFFKFSKIQKKIKQEIKDLTPKRIKSF